MSEKSVGINRASFSLRHKYIAKPRAVNELTKANIWRHISSEFGYQLVKLTVIWVCAPMYIYTIIILQIDIDYELSSLGKSCANAVWPHILSVAGNYIKQRSIDEPSTQLLKNLNDDLRSEGKFFVYNRNRRKNKMS